MAKVSQRKVRNRSIKRTRRKESAPKLIPSVTPMRAALQLATEVDAQVGKGTLRDGRIATHRSRVTKGMVRDWKGSFGQAIRSVGVAAFAWPDGMYVPRDNASILSIVRPPADHLYSDAWTDNRGISKADANAGTLFAWSGVPTTERDQIGEAGLGVRYSPKNTLSYIRFEPEVDCSVTYRAFVDFWPQLIAGSVRARGSLLMVAWKVTRILNVDSFELLRPWNEVTVFDTGNRDAGTDLSPDIHNINTFQKSFSWSNLGTTFLLEGARTYLLGVVARVEVHHSVTTNTGKVIPHDGSLFKLYSFMTCNVPDIFVSIQKVLLP
jgi:hypothetical protein